jgi:hypothetical protein
MIYFFHHYELPVIVQQARLQQMFMRPTRGSNNNRQAADNGQAGTTGGQGTGINASASSTSSSTPTNNDGGNSSGGNNQQMNRENQQVRDGAPMPATAEAPPVNNINNMFLIRGAYRRRVNHIVERLRNNFYNNVLGIGLMAADNNNNNNAANNLQNQPGFNNLTRSLRLLNMLFPNRPILNVRIINVRSASASATAADILRTTNRQNVSNVDGEQQQQQESFPSVVRLDQQPQADDERQDEGNVQVQQDATPVPLIEDANHVNVSEAEPEDSSKCHQTLPESSLLTSTTTKTTTKSDVYVNQSVNVMQSTTNDEVDNDEKEHHSGRSLTFSSSTEMSTAASTATSSLSNEEEC